MKRLICIMLVFAFSSFLFTGCKTKKNSAGAIARKQAEIILECLKTGEKEELKALFCERVKNTHNLDKEIQEAIDFIDGEIVGDVKLEAMFESGSSVTDGMVIDSHITPKIKKIKTSADKEYSIYFHAYIINANDNYVGITKIDIYEEDDSKEVEDLNSVRIGEYVY